MSSFTLLLTKPQYNMLLQWNEFLYICLIGLFTSSVLELSSWFKNWLLCAYTRIVQAEYVQCGNYNRKDGCMSACNVLKNVEFILKVVRNISRENEYSKNNLVTLSLGLRSEKSVQWVWRKFCSIKNLIYLNIFAPLTELKLS